jgi:formylglycine-generating enzyme required for sulfatase activity
MNDAVRDEQANGYRLPTNAEWEYAARGGYPSATWTYTYVGTTSSSNASTWAHFSDGSGVTAVYNKTANSLGLYQMTGNAYKYMWDVLPVIPSGSRGVRGGNRSLTVDGVAIDNYDYWSADQVNTYATIRVTANSVGE